MLLTHVPREDFDDSDIYDEAIAMLGDEGVVLAQGRVIKPPRMVRRQLRGAYRKVEELPPPIQNRLGNIADRNVRYSANRLLLGSRPARKMSENENATILLEKSGGI